MNTEKFTIDSAVHGKHDGENFSSIPQGMTIVFVSGCDLYLLYIIDFSVVATL